MRFFWVIILAWFIWTNGIGQCDLSPLDGIPGPVEVEIIEFLVTNVTETGTTCQVDYSVTYQVLSSSCSIFFMQGVVACTAGSQTTLNLNQSGTMVTETGSIFNAECSGNCSFFINAGWGGSCANTTIVFPGTNCLSVAYGVTPVKLTQFEARTNSSNIDISWETDEESNSSHFILEHSRNGTDFKELTTQAGQGNSIETYEYSYTHLNPSNGVHYYRLKQVDFDGSFIYSEIEQATLNNSSYSIHPNPSNGLLQLAHDHLKNQPFALYTITGRVLKEGWINRTGMLNLNIQHPGLYFLKIGHSGRMMEKIIVE